jgi:hypothetical protein
VSQMGHSLGNSLTSERSESKQPWRSPMAMGEGVDTGF